jgi:putative ribosome biogenesis GTPase RsgA
MYRVILVKNGKYKMTLHRCKTKETSFKNYHRLIEENQSVMFPRQYINYNGIKKVRYKIYVVKDTEEGDEFRTLRNSVGKTYKEKPLFGIWTAFDDHEYQIEETFWMYGKDPKTDRVTIHDIVKPLIINMNKSKYTKQVIVVHNKLVIYNEEQFDMIICKNKKDAQRLHHALQKATLKAKIKGILYMGTATPASVSRMYEVIHEHTKWPYTKIRRTSTRP